MSALYDALKQAEARYWRVDVNFYGADGFVSASRGDSNCSHAGPYNNETGHGFEAIEDEVFDSLESLAAWIAGLPEVKK